MITLPSEIKKICDNLIEENKVFDYPDAIEFCDVTLKDMELNYFEYSEALHYCIIGLEVEQEKI